MVVAVITGGRDRHPTITELENALDRLRERSATVVRHGDCRGTDKSVATWLKARAGGELALEAWPAEAFGSWPACGPKRNRAMLDGHWPGHQELFGTLHPPAAVLLAFRGGAGTSSCSAAALERGLPIEWIHDVVEPRPWNRHHGAAPQPNLYIGRARDPRQSSPLANPWPLELAPGQSRADGAEANLGRYKRWLWERIRPGGRHHDPRVVDALEQITARHHLVCSCWPNRCHAEVVIAAWRWMHRE